MEEAVDDIQRGLFVGVESSLLSVAFGDRWADKDFAQVVFIQWEGDAIGGRRILEKRLVQFSDCFAGDKVEGDFFAGGA